MTCDLVETLLKLNRGTDVLQEIAFEDDEKQPVNMTGWTVSIFEADPWMQANATVVWSDQAAGKASLRADWSATTPATAWVRLVFTRTLDGFDDSTNVLKIEWS